MNLEELKTMAQKILAIKPGEKYEHKVFSCRSGGTPRNNARVKVVHNEQRWEYDTVRNGSAYSGSLTIECRDTGTQDKNGRTIYETPDGMVFVYSYRKGSPESFDSGSLEPPSFSV